jgi:FKBP-type peptidyl-prolyl cis-trans isomerase
MHSRITAVAALVLSAAVQVKGGRVRARARAAVSRPCHAILTALCRTNSACAHGQAAAFAPLAPTGLSRAAKPGRCSLAMQMHGGAEPVSRAAFMQRLAGAAATVGAAPLSSAWAADATESGDPAWAAHDGPFSDSDFADFQTTASGLKYKDVVEGDGAQPAQTDTVRAYYAGYLLDGKLFDTSYRPALFPFSLITPSGPPTAFKLGRGGLIPGFEEGAHMLPASVRGHTEHAGVELRKQNLFLHVCAHIPAKNRQLAHFRLPLATLWYVRVCAWVGFRVCSNVRVWVYMSCNAYYVHIGIRRLRTHALARGTLRLRACIMVAGLLGMKVGGKRICYIAPELGYGKAGGGPIPPNAPLVFYLELRSIGGGVVL